MKAKMIKIVAVLSAVLVLLPFATIPTASATSSPRPYLNRIKHDENRKAWYQVRASDKVLAYALDGDEGDNSQDIYDGGVNCNSERGIYRYQKRVNRMNYDIYYDKVQIRDIEHGWK